ncbi:hypothetical protein D9M68_441320 [compost metagenome]
MVGRRLVQVDQFLPGAQFAHQAGLLLGLDRLFLARLLAEDALDVLLQLVQFGLGLLDAHQFADQAGAFGITRGLQALAQRTILLLDLGSGRLDALAAGLEVVQVQLGQGLGVLLCLVVGLLLLLRSIEHCPGCLGALLQRTSEVALLQLVFAAGGPGGAVGGRFLLQSLHPVFILLGQALGAFVVPGGRERSAGGRRRGGNSSGRECQRAGGIQVRIQLVLPGLDLLLSLGQGFLVARDPLLVVLCIGLVQGGLDARHVAGLAINRVLQADRVVTRRAIDPRRGLFGQELGDAHSAAQGLGSNFGHLAEGRDQGIQPFPNGRILQCLLQLANGIGIGVDEARLASLDLQVGEGVLQAIQLGIEAAGGFLGSWAVRLLQGGAEARQELSGRDHPFLQPLAQLLGVRAQGLGGQTERTRYALAELQHQFLGLHLALADHLLQGEQDAVGLLAGKVQGGGRRGHAVEDGLQRLAQLGRFFGGGDQLGVGLAGVQQLQAETLGDLADVLQLLTGLRGVAGGRLHGVQGLLPFQVGVHHRPGGRSDAVATDTDHKKALQTPSGGGQAGHCHVGTIGLSLNARQGITAGLDLLHRGCVLVRFQSASTKVFGELPLLLVKLCQATLGAVDLSQKFLQGASLLLLFGRGFGGSLRRPLLGRNLGEPRALGVAIGVHCGRLRAGVGLPVGVTCSHRGTQAMGTGGGSILGGLLLQAGGDHGLDAGGLLVGRFANLGDLAGGFGSMTTDVVEGLAELVDSGLRLIDGTSGTHLLQIGIGRAGFVTDIADGVGQRFDGGLAVFHVSAETEGEF